MRIMAGMTIAAVAATAACGSSRADDTSPGSTAAPTAADGGLTITRTGSRPPQPGPAAWFSGTATIQPLFQATEHTRAAGASVTFEPGARTAWHSHPAGQTLVVTAGAGWVQESGGQKLEIKPGDVVWTPSGRKHWHGATPTDAMTHIAIQEHVDGKVVDWMEHVTDDEYGSAPARKRDDPVARGGPWSTSAISSPK